jgi:hypothetical protein
MVRHWSQRIASLKRATRVAMQGEKGTFVVYDVGGSLECAELKLIGHELAMSSIPWSKLTFLDERKNALRSSNTMRRARTQR